MTSSVRELARPVVLADRYTLVRALATGGMAEIFLARQKAMAGFDKEVVVKLLRDRYRNDPRVVEMFMNEARIGAILSHPNVAHVFDMGEHERQPFIVMEHIEGDELSQLCRRGLEIAKFLPLEHAVDLMRQSAEALGYFHSRREGGQALDIVHRDISPSNLLVTRDGVAKIIDFGIARATWPGQKQQTDDKHVPGKYNYMSPEQVRGERVDNRSDIYSLGIVLYEITVGKRLYKGRPEEVIQKITRGRIKPPTFIRRQFPPALEAIVMRALEPHRNDRYATAYELANDLEEFLRTASLKSGPVRIAQYLDELRTAEGGEHRPELVIAGEAWLDDDGEEALDFDRGFSVNVKPIAPPPLASVPAPVDQLIEKLEARADVAKTFENDGDEEAKTSVAEDVSKTANLRPMPRGEGGEEVLSISNAGVEIDSDLGEDIPTDAGMVLPYIDPNDPANCDMTARLTRAEPTTRIPLAIPRAQSSGPNTKKMTRLPGIAMPLGLGEVRRPTSPVLAVPLQAPPTGRIPLDTPMPMPPPLARPAALADIDPASSTDTPLPAVPDPRTFEDTSRVAYAEPFRHHLAVAGSLKVLRAESPSLSDSMAMTIPGERQRSAPKVITPKTRAAGRRRRSVANYQKRALQLGEVSLAPGGDIVSAKPKKNLPWPVIGGAAALFLMLLYLLLR